ncbi:hypothetical protein GCM10011504_53620 [Siccirubricoccus deserti]|uniref:Lipoprotein n=1 Tax=Siccirubricoccus deserti TaxID=2013562 RepID=A0A9X0UFK9_9PROT|nr:hypothetical protein [Siccirubricoccus deserti]MBC4018882.1 hypothetical protein [Siccirubricoccus deserti]GGC68977.1 hypothetical protein GCM10011504_53620 [Siccirubricoccus deserti]
MSTIGIVRSLSVLSLLAAAGCAEFDPYHRAGMWQPSGANAANIASMVARPADLTSGRGTSQGDGRRAASAVQRMRDADAREGTEVNGPGAGMPAAGGTTRWR